MCKSRETKKWQQGEGAVRCRRWEGFLSGFFLKGEIPPPSTEEQPWQRDSVLSAGGQSPIPQRCPKARTARRPYSWEAAFHSVLCRPQRCLRQPRCLQCCGSSLSEEAPRKSQGNYWLQAWARREVILKGEWRHCRCLWRLCSHYVWGVSSISLLGWITCIIHGKFQLLSWLAKLTSLASILKLLLLWLSALLFLPSVAGRGPKSSSLAWTWKHAAYVKAGAQAGQLENASTSYLQHRDRTTALQSKRSLASSEGSWARRGMQRAEPQGCCLSQGKGKLLCVSNFLCSCCSNKPSGLQTRRCSLLQYPVLRCSPWSQAAGLQGTNREKPGNSWLANLAFPLPFHELTNQTTHA